jgi:hypothetical protein
MVDLFRVPAEKIVTNYPHSFCYGYLEIQELCLYIDMSKKVLVVSTIAILIIGGGSYLLSQNNPNTHSVTTTSTPADVKVSVYSGNGWQMSYPSTLTPQKRKSPATTELVGFNSTNSDGFTVLVNNTPLDRRDSQIMKSKAVGIDLLKEVLALQTKNIPPTVKISDSGIVRIGDVDAIQVAMLDTSLPKSPSVSVKTTFVKGSNLIDVTLMVNAKQATQAEVDVYNSMVSSFKFQ